VTFFWGGISYAASTQPSEDSLGDPWPLRGASPNIRCMGRLQRPAPWIHQGVGHRPIEEVGLSHCMCIYIYTYIYIFIHIYIYHLLYVSSFAHLAPLLAPLISAEMWTHSNAAAPVTVTQRARGRVLWHHPQA
jgi:hypothetical protein